jgi:hypothetical protein
MTNNKALMVIPKNAQLKSQREEVANLTSSNYDMTTKTLGTWISASWLGSGAATAGFFIFPDYHYVTFAIPTVLSILTGISLFVFGITGITDSSSMSGPFKAIKKAGSEDSSFVDDYYYGSHGRNSRILLKKKVNQLSPLHLFLPLRIFKKQLISEVITYTPNTDTYAKTNAYFTFTGVKKVTQEFSGRRASFKKALDSI